jgi:hypothetical protein
MKQEIFDHLNDRLKACQRQMEGVKGHDPLAMRKRAILSVKIASLQGRIRYLTSEVKVFLPNYSISITTNQIPHK